MAPLALPPIRLELWTLLAIALLGVSRIPEPFAGDQALFALMARSLQRGATLYSLAFASQSAASPGKQRTRMLGAGVAAGVVALFKLMLAPIPALAWMVAYAV